MPIGPVVIAMRQGEIWLLLQLVLAGRMLLGAAVLLLLLTRLAGCGVAGHGRCYCAVGLLLLRLNDLRASAKAT